VVLILVLIQGAAPRSAAAQVLEDTLAADSLRAEYEDTVDNTARYLQALEQQEVRVPVLQALAAPGPRPALTRLVFTRDSIEWLSGATVGDLLAQVPGVYLWRGGYIGRPEPVAFQGRGGTSAEYYLDGVPYVAAGVDSVAVDPALFSISFLDRYTCSRGGRTGSPPARGSRSPAATVTSPATRARSSAASPRGWASRWPPTISTPRPQAG